MWGGFSHEGDYKCDSKSCSYLGEYEHFILLLSDTSFAFEDGCVWDHIELSSPKKTVATN